MLFRQKLFPLDSPLRSARMQLVFPIIMGLAVLLRISGIETQNLWFDESFSYYETTYPISSIVDSATTVAGHPPLFCVTLKGWQSVSGDTPAGMRLLSTLFNCLTIVLVFQILKKHSRPAALAAAFFLAIAPSQIHFSNEIRMYAMLAFFCLLALYSYQRSMDLRFASIGFNILAVASMALAFYTHMLGVLITISLLAHSAILTFSRATTDAGDRKAIVKRLASIYVATLLLCLPWVYMMFATQEALIAGQAWRAPLTLIGVAGDLGMFFVSSIVGGLYFNDVANWKVGAMQVFTALGFLGTIATMFLGLRQKQMPSHIRAMAIVGPGLTFLFVLVSRRSFELSRYLFFATPFFVRRRGIRTHRHQTPVPGHIRFCDDRLYRVRGIDLLLQRRIARQRPQARNQHPPGAHDARGKADHHALGPR